MPEDTRNRPPPSGGPRRLDDLLTRLRPLLATVRGRAAEWAADAALGARIVASRTGRWSRGLAGQALTPRRALLLAPLVLAAATGAIILALLLPVLVCRADDCPSIEAIAAYHPPEASRVFAADGSILADLSPHRRVVVALEEIAPVLRDGVVAVEDRRFWQHSGVDPRGVVRAAWRNTRSAQLREGFSTLEMQLARNIFPETLPLSNRGRRKVWEVYLASRMDAVLSKEEILERYLNQIYLGSGLYGVEAAAQAYFGKPAADVTAAQAALLIALIKTPERYNPRRSPDRARERRDLVLALLAERGVLDPEEAAQARSEDVELAAPRGSKATAPYFVIALRRELEELFGSDAAERGLRVFTGLDPELQAAAQTALRAQIARIEGGQYGRWRHPVPDSGGRLAPAPGASPYLQGMVVALDPETGLVRALVGGRDFAHSQYDRALQARRQPGSAFKAIVYAAAVEFGMPPTALVSTAPVEIRAAGAPVWRPNDHIADSVGMLTVRDALARSSNTAAVRVGRWVGQDAVITTARKLGITTPLEPVRALPLGSEEVIPAELVAAYAALGNGGWRVRPRLIGRVEDATGRILWTAPEARERAIGEAAAFVTLTLLEDVVDRGTGASIRSAGFWAPAAGKTGTTDEGKDVWFVGMTPDLVAGVWLGFDQPAPIGAGASGSRMAAPVWADMMKRHYDRRRLPLPWQPPGSVIALPIDESTGQVATPDCPGELVRTEYFVPGTEPAAYCPRHNRRGFFDRLWGRLRRSF
ncbi:MAG TPA: PBP1A family penicillin-binding protein [Longimicrobiales bacterium]|nr:PBP1A family penicillin-binding protein [Longimicrobiales bacterium]